MIVKFAFDKSMRTVDADGRLHIERSHISKAMVCPYYGKEIPEYEALGLDPNKVYRLLRDPVELERGAQTFARLPILSEHIPVTVDDPRPDLVVGAIGSDIKFEAPYLDADLCIWDANAIVGIDSGKVKELSCAYRYVAVMDAGEFEGQQYDGVMTEIKGNHLALVEVGRAGADVVAADRNPFTFEEITMNMTKLGKALFAALSVASPKLAADSALSTLVGSTTRKNFKKDEVKAKLIAMDASLDSNKLDSVLEAIMDVNEDPNPQQTPMAAADESPADKVKKMLAGKVDDKMIEEICKMMSKPAQDAENPEGNDDEEEPTQNDQPVAAKDGDKGMKPVEVKAAMDKAIDKVKKDMLATAEAVRDVRPVVGDVIGMDSAASVYTFALDHMSVEHEGVKDVPSLKALFKVAVKSNAQAPVIAQDAGGLVSKFPNAARFRNA